MTYQEMASIILATARSSVERYDEDFDEGLAIGLETVRAKHGLETAARVEIEINLRLAKSAGVI